MRAGCTPYGVNIATTPPYDPTDGIQRYGDLLVSKRGVQVFAYHLVKRRIKLKIKLSFLFFFRLVFWNRNKDFLLSQSVNGKESK